MAALPPILLGYQQEWVADDSRVRVWEKSRRIGASWVIALESVLAGARARGGCDTWYTSYNKKTTAEFIRDCALWSEIISAVAAEVSEEVITGVDGDEILAYVIRFPTGHKITALSSNPSNLRNIKGRVVIDEAAHVADLGESLKAAMAILMWGGSVDILSTHNGVDSEFNKLIEDIRGERKNYSLHRTDLDDALADGLYKRICLVNGQEWSEEKESAWRDELISDYGDDAQEELFCIPAKSGGTYLPRMLIEDRMIEAPIYRFEAPEGFALRDDDQRERVMKDWLERNVEPALKKLPVGLMHSIGEDFGRTVDLTVLAPVTIQQDLQRKVPFLVELRDTPFREQEQALNFVIDGLPRFVGGALDATGNGQYMAERAWQKYGEELIEQVHLSDKWYSENLPPVKAALEDSMFWVPRDADVLSDLTAFQLIDGVPKLPKSRKKQKSGAKSGTAKRHGDAAIAIVLAHYASRQEIPTYEYTAAGSATGAGRGAVKRGHGFRSAKGGIL